MYSEKIVERNIAQVFDDVGVELQHYDDENVDEMSAHLSSLVKSYDKDGNVAEWNRPPNKQEWAYVNNERLLCKFDFRYFTGRYAVIRLVDPVTSNTWNARLGTLGFMSTQEALLSKIAKIEEGMYDNLDQGYSVDGIKILIHKARQTGFTALCRMIDKQRTLFWPDTNALAASINEPMVQELYDRDKIIYDNLPWFLRPPIEYDVKNSQLSFKEIKSGTVFHQANQHGGMGTGKSLDVVHLTECALWDEQGGDTAKIEFDLFPTIPQSIRTIYMLESTANGFGGWWYDEVHKILRGKSLFDLFFCPWYAADKKYRRHPKAGWEPSDFTKAMAVTAERTSPTYMGKSVILDKEQLYWYETTMNMHEKRLGFFLSNYPTTLEESFQQFDRSAFSTELLASLRSGIDSLWGTFDMNTAGA